VSPSHNFHQPCRVEVSPYAIVRGLYHLESTPGLISFLAGKPNVSTFPFTSLSFTARSPDDRTQESVHHISEADLAEALQYGATAGLAGLCDWFVGLQEFSHGRRRGEGWRVNIGTGSQDLIYKVGHAVLMFHQPFHMALCPGSDDLSQSG
jgi:tryptophan aminotransferase